MTVIVKDANGNLQSFATQLANTVHTPYHLEDSTQRAALLSALALIATDTKLEAVRLLLAGTLSTAPSVDQDPIFNHTAGVKVTVTTTSTDIITPPASCKFIRITTDTDCFVRTDGSAAIDDGHCIRLIANLPETIPVVANTKVTGIVASGVAVVRATPLKVR